ncbi:MAG: hypothetical protein PHZ24_02835 [Bacteroidales bacterium]|nr:hypothetical protein [Bacteroidales bacterium]
MGSWEWGVRSGELRVKSEERRIELAEVWGVGLFKQLYNYKKNKELYYSSIVFLSICF